MTKAKKTNAIRYVEQKKIAHTVIEYPIEDGLTDGFSVAEKTNQNPEEIFKTLVTLATDGQIFVFLLPLTKELDLKKAASVAGVKKIDLLPLPQLTKVTGYVRGGCSPIGMKKLFPTFLEQSAMSLNNIIVSGGRPGLQLCISPNDIIALTKAKMFTV